MIHLAIDPQLVAGHIVGDNWQTFGGCWIHPVDINVHFLEVCDFSEGHLDIHLLLELFEPGGVVSAMFSVLIF